MRGLLACALGALVLLAPASAHAVLPGLPGLERETPSNGCPFGFVVLPGTTCPKVPLLTPEEAEKDAAENPRPPGGPVNTSPGPYSAHSQIYACCTPSEQMQRIFAAARSTGAGYIRLDINLRGIFAVRNGRPRTADWTGVDRVAALARAYRLPVVAVLTHVPDHITKCNTDHSSTCPAGDVDSYGRYAALIAKRLEGVARYFEIVNEPDGRYAFKGSPQEYARMLVAARHHIRTRVPSARVLLGGLLNQVDRTWISQMLATPGVNAARSFDIANVHIRGWRRGLASDVKRARSFFASRGFRGPIWVTEHGYPSDTRFQYDPAFRGGERAQAAFINRSLPALRRGGAGQVFVTLRDSWLSEFGIGQYTSEGLISVAERAPFAIRRKPAFDTFVAANLRWRKAQRLIAARRKQLRAARRAGKAGKRRKAKRHRRLAKRYALRLKRLGDY